MARRWGSHRIPGNLRIEMGMTVDNSRREYQTIGINLNLRRASTFTDLGDALARDPDAPEKRWSAGPIDDESVPDQKIGFHPGGDTVTCIGSTGPVTIPAWRKTSTVTASSSGIISTWEDQHPNAW